MLFRSLGAKAETGAFEHAVTGLTAGKTYHVRAYATDAQGTVYGEDKTFSTTGNPTITDFTPTEAGQGDTVTVTGTNFNGLTTDIIVKIGTTTATNIVSANLTEFKFVVPAGATEGANKLIVSIKGIEVTASTDFTYWGGLWTQKKDFGGAAREFAVSFNIGTKGYIGLGRTDQQFNKGLSDLWEYDAATDTWTQKASYSGGKRTAPVAFVIQDIAFVGLGLDETRAEKKDFWQYKPATNTWTQLTDFAGTYKIEGGEIAFSVGSSGFVAKLNSNELWEINLNAWTKKNNLPFTSTKTAFVINDIAYLRANDNKLWKYNKDTDSWTALKDLPGSVFLSGMVANGKGYIAGGSQDNYNMWEYEPTNDTWSKKIGLSGRVNVPSYSEGFAIGNKVYVRVGGFSRSSFWEFDPTK